MRAGSEVCDLCGYDGTDVPDAAEPGDADGLPAPSHVANEVASPATAEELGVYCNQCGWKNPPGARFCSQCGSPLQLVSNPGAPRPQAGTGEQNAPGVSRPVAAGVDPDAAPIGERPEVAAASGAPTARPQRGAADFRTMSAVIVAGALLLVVVLYAVTAFSKKAFVPVAEPPPQETVSDTDGSGEEFVPPVIADQVAVLQASADSLSGAVRAARLAEIVNLYLSQGLYQHAAEAQATVADELGTADSWADAGNIGYRAMQEAEGPAKIALASQAIDAYSRSLAIDSTNLDVRTDMATAFLATNNPMEGVRQIRMVLDQNPDHVQANFNYGVMLSMIGRRDQSIAQFERVRSLVEPGTETYQQAERALQELQGP